MHLVALLRRPADPDAATRLLVEAAGLTAAEARMRLAPDPPALLARVPAAAAGALVERLRDQGLAALAIPEAVPGDDQRTVGRTLALDERSLTVTPRSGAPRAFEWERVSVLLRAASSLRTRTDVTETSRKVSIGMAVLSGGLKNTRSVEQTTRTTVTETEQSIYVYAGDGAQAVLRERALDFTCLGAAMQPVRLANMAVLAKLLRERAPRAAYDERLLRLGTRPLPFVVGGEAHFNTANVSASRVSTAHGVDVLAELLRRGFESGLLP